MDSGPITMGAETVIAEATESATLEAADYSDLRMVVIFSREAGEEIWLVGVSGVPGL